MKKLLDKVCAFISAKTKKGIWNMENAREMLALKENATKIKRAKEKLPQEKSNLLDQITKLETQRGDLQVREVTESGGSYRKEIEDLSSQIEVATKRIREIDILSSRLSDEEKNVAEKIKKLQIEHLTAKLNKSAFNLYVQYVADMKAILARQVILQELSRLSEEREKIVNEFNAITGKSFLFPGATFPDAAFCARWREWNPRGLNAAALQTEKLNKPYPWNGILQDSDFEFMEKFLKEANRPEYIGVI